jgi:hypothetical protein
MFRLPRIIKIKNAFCLAFVVTFLTACGGGGGGDADKTVAPPPTPANQAPTVDAGTDQNIYTGSRVTLSGSASDSDGSISTYKWELTDYVAGSAALTLIDTDKAMAYFETEFNVPEEQAFTFTFTATDNDGATSSDTVIVKIAPTEFTYVDISLPENINQARLTQITDDLILVSGGCKAFQAGICIEGSKKAFLFSLADNSLTPIGDLYYNRYTKAFVGQSANVLSDGRVLFCFSNIDFGCEIYDPNSQTFSIIDSFSKPRDAMMPVVLDNSEVVFFGGRSGINITDDIEVYNPTTESWVILDIKLPEAKGNILTAKLSDNRALLIGGSHVTNKIYIYDHADKSINEINNYPVPINGNGGASYQQVNKDSGNICLIPRGSAYIVHYNSDTQSTTESNGDECPIFSEFNVIQQRVQRESELNAGKGVNVIVSSEKVWIKQQIDDSAITYDAACNCYSYDEAMIIRVLKVKE